METIKFMVDLNTCKQGDKLLSRQGEILTYVRKLLDTDYHDHEVMYLNGSFGTRMNDGHVFKNTQLRNPNLDHDIILILKGIDMFMVSVEQEIVYIGVESDCRKVLNILYEYYKEDKPTPSIIMTNQKDVEGYEQMYGTEQTYIEKCLDTYIDFNYGD